MLVFFRFIKNKSFLFLKFYHKKIKINDLIKNFLKCKKIENLKSKSTITNYFENEDDEDVDDGLSFADTSTTDDLESFLNALKLSNLIKLFKVKNVSMQKLVNYGEDDLKNVGILDDYIRQLILNEIRKFHHKNWLSTSLLPTRYDMSPK